MRKDYSNVEVVKLENKEYGVCIEWKKGGFDSWEEKADNLKDVKNKIVKIYNVDPKDICYISKKQLREINNK